MFESVTPDPGQDALRRAGRIFRVIAVLVVLGSALQAVLVLSDGGSLRLLPLLFNLALAVVSWITAGGIEEQQSWARWVGIVVGLLELVNIPIGTVIGVAILVYLVRAS
jgi:nitrate reductase gamma subunit